MVGEKHINRPFEVCLLPVLPISPNEKKNEKVGGKQGWIPETGVPITNAGQKPQQQ